MKLKLEDLTKDELIRVIRENWFPGPKQRDMLFVRWHSLVAKSQHLSEEGLKASKACDWGRAEKLYAESERAWKQADAMLVLADAE